MIIDISRRETQQQTAINKTIIGYPSGSKGSLLLLWARRIGKSTAAQVITP
jgi:hypothetical protein